VADVYRVVSEGDNWKVTREDGTVITTHATKEDAIAAAVAMATASRPSQLMIEREDGTWEEEQVYASPEQPPPTKRSDSRS
jgi:hypothetical protein